MWSLGTKLLEIRNTRCYLGKAEPWSTKIKFILFKVRHNEPSVGTETSGLFKIFSSLQPTGFENTVKIKQKVLKIQFSFLIALPLRKKLDVYFTGTLLNTKFVPS